MHILQFDVHYSRHIVQLGKKNLFYSCGRVLCSGIKLRNREINVFPMLYTIFFLPGVQKGSHRLTKFGATSKFWLKLTDVKPHCRKTGHLSITLP